MEFDPIYITYGSLIFLAVVPIVFGSLLAIENEQKEDSDNERISKSDAYWFPVLGSVTLFSFYVVFKYFPKEYVNYLLTAYFSLFGTMSVVQLTVRICQFFVPKELEMTGHIHVGIENSKKESILDINVTWLNVLMTILSSIFTGYYVYTKNWIASNIFAEAFSMTAISMIHLDTFMTGIILLSGLFLYDIFWVFGTNVMVSVAKNFDVPVKLLFPRDVLTDSGANFSMLGLGDIVLPGVFIALCLKFDRSLGCRSYFFNGIFAYLAGLGTTMYVMHTFKAAQPALLYLSPACILSALGTALVRGELSKLFGYTTETVTKASKPATKKAAKSD